MPAAFLTLLVTMGSSATVSGQEPPPVAMAGHWEQDRYGVGATQWKAVSDQGYLMAVLTLSDSEPGERLARGASFESNGSPRALYGVTYRGRTDVGVVLELRVVMASDQCREGYKDTLTANMGVPGFGPQAALDQVRSCEGDANVADVNTLYLPTPPTSLRIDRLLSRVPLMTFIVHARGTALSLSLTPGAPR